MTSYIVIGTGAIGGYCAIKLHKANFNVHCLLRSDFEHVKNQGLSLISDDAKITVPIKVYNDVRTMPTCDVILVALKATENSVLKDLLPHIMHQNTAVVLLQNGIGLEQELAEFVAPEKIMGGSCMIKVSKTTPGLIRHFGGNTIELAQYYQNSDQEGVTAQLELLADNFKAAGIISVLCEHLPTMRWKKLSGNIPCNGLSVVLDAYSKDLVNSAPSYQLLCEMTKEVIDVAKKCGAKLPEDIYQFRLGVLESFKKMEKNYSSMKEDFDSKRPLELHAIFENAINIAETNGVAMPLTKMLYQQLLYLNENNLIGSDSLMD